jgi:ATP-binding cassette, subfamily B, bacterial PglK
MLQQIFKLYYHFLKPDGWKFYLLIIALIFSSVAELVGVAAVYPLMQLMTGDENESKILLFILGISTKLKMSPIFLTFLACLVLVCISMFIKIFTTKYKFQYMAYKDSEITIDMFENFLHMNYSWYTTVNLSEKTKILLTDITLVVIQGVLSTVNIISNIILIFIFMMLLISAEPLLTIIILTFFTFGYSIFYGLTRARIKKYSSNRLQSNNDRFRVVNHLLAGISEIRINKLQNLMLSEFKKANTNFVDSFAATQFLALLPRFLLEFLVLFGFLIYMITLYSTNLEIEEQIPILTLFAFSALKLLPSVQQIYYSIAQIGYIEKTFDELQQNMFLESHKNLNLDRAEHNFLTNTQNRYAVVTHLSGEGVSLELNGKKIFDGINFSFTNEKLNYILGPSGCGKSSLIKTLLGFYEVSSGILSLNQEEITNINREQLFSEIIGYVPQDIYIFNDSLNFNLTMQRETPTKSDNVQQLRSLMEVFELDKLTPYLSDDNKYLSANGISISGGQRQRIGILREVLKAPSIFIFDEAFTGISTDLAKKLLSYIELEFPDALIIIITHDASLVNENSTVLRLNENN